MVFNPGVPFFIPFHELDPSRDKTCIFFTVKGARCRNFREESDMRRAIELHKAINTISGDAIGFDLLQEYVLCTCCRRAKHRDRIEDIDLLIPLAQRWQNEILGHAGFNTSVVVLGESIFAPAARTVLATPSPSDTTTLISAIESPFNCRLDGLTSSSINEIPSTPVTSSLSFQHGSSKSSATTAFKFQQLESRPRYDLRRGETVNSTSTQTKLSSRSPLSEFRPHVATPCPSDSVSSRLLAPLERRDFEIGSIYIFDRTSSPGHVKIGWTAGSVSRRLESWSTCGYIPNLLFRVDHVPHAQRVETLTHHELIKEWRRERMCKALHCGKSHQEWFEITKERAAQVVSYWADFMKRAQPYDLNGRLKTQWRVVIEMFDRNEEVVTGKRLLDCYERSLVEVVTVVVEASPIHDSEDLKQKLKIEDMGFGDGRNLGQLHRLAKTSVRVDSLLIEGSPVSNEEPLLRNGLLHGTPALMDESLSNSETQMKGEPIHEDLTQMTTVMEEVAPEKIPLPPSPIVQPKTSAQNIPLLQDTGPISSTGPKTTSAIDTAPSCPINVTVADISSNSRTSILLSSSAPASSSAHYGTILDDTAFKLNYETE